MRMAAISFLRITALTGFGLLAGPVLGQSVPDPTETVPLSAAPPYSATGDLFILKADTNAAALRNPVLVVEGFDIDNTMGWDILYTLLNQEHLAEDLQAYGRDLLVLNFTDSTIDILANAALTESAIRYINDHRLDPDDKFTAVGVSLGGLTVRKALIDLPDHDVDTWISFEAPHEGANIPLGLQEFFEYFSAVNVATFDPIREFLAALDRPASRQLLLAHHSHAPDAPAGASAPERQEFMDVMNAGGYPTNCKSIAISNGSGGGTPLPFSPGELVLHWDHQSSGILDPTINADIHALPLSTNTAGTVFSGAFDVWILGRDPVTINSYSPLLLDNAPGGYRSTFLQLFTNLPPDYVDAGDYCAYTNHCFIPTVSALGIPIEYSASNLAANTGLLAMSPFDEIHYAIENEEHVEINAHNKRWIVRAILEDYDSDRDGFDDYQEYLMGTDYDSADSTLEIAQTIASQPTNGTVRIAWDARPNTQYEVWFTETLTNTWQHLETVAPTTDSPIIHEYLPTPETPAGFFLISAAPIDPVTD